MPIKSALLLLLTSLVLFNTAVSKSKETVLKPLVNTASLSYSVEGSFEEVKEDLVMAIESQGAVISYIAHSSEMLNRTAITLNIKKKVYQDAAIVLFCKAEISHKMVQADPHSLSLCPYPIAIYTLADSPNTVYLTIRKPPENLPTYSAIQEFLLKVIAETIEF